MDFETFIICVYIVIILFYAYTCLVSYISLCIWKDVEGSAETIASIINQTGTIQMKNWGCQMKNWGCI